MTTTNTPHRVQRTMTILARGVILTAAAAVRAADTDDGRHSRDRKGWLVGMSAGWGHSLYSEKGGDRTITDDPVGSEGLFSPSEAKTGKERR